MPAYFPPSRYRHHRVIETARFLARRRGIAAAGPATARGAGGADTGGAHADRRAGGWRALVRRLFERA